MLERKVGQLDRRLSLETAPNNTSSSISRCPADGRHRKNKNNRRIAREALASPATTRFDRQLSKASNREGWSCAPREEGWW